MSAEDKWLDGKIVEYKEGACDTCGGRRAFEGAKLCTNCWEVEGRIDQYVRSGKGRLFVVTALEMAKQEIDRKKFIAAIEAEQLSDDLENESDHAYRAAIRAAVEAVRKVEL